MPETNALAGMNPEANFPHLREDPFRPPAEYEKWRDQAPVCPAQLHSNQRAWVVVGHAAAREALTHPGMSVDVGRPGFPFVRKGATARSSDTTLRTMDPPVHAKIRRMMASQFSAKRVQELQPELERIVIEAIDAILAKGGPLDLQKEFSLVVPTKVICALLGVDYALSGEIQRFSSFLTSSASSADELQAAAGGCTRCSTT